MVDKLAVLYGVPVHVTPVGFKFVGAAMIENDAIAAGEESGGYAFRGNIPERDGILSGLLFLDLMVKTGKYPSELVRYLHERIGEHAYGRIDVALSDNQRMVDPTHLVSHRPDSLGGLLVDAVDRTDGVRYLLDGGFWGLIRPSGTEPLTRFYAEGDTPERVDRILKELQTLAGI